MRVRVCEREGREIEDRHTDREERKVELFMVLTCHDIYIYILNYFK